MENTYDNLGYVGEIQRKVNQLDEQIKRLRKNGTDFAMARYNYEIKKSEETAMMRADGMAISEVSLRVRGQKGVASLRLKRDIAEVVYKANQESINAIKLEIRILDNQLQREYGANLND